MSASHDGGGPVRELLVRLLLSEKSAARAAGQDIATRGAWSDVVALANEWRILPRLNQRLATLAMAPSEPARNQLRRLSAAAFMRSAVLARRGVALLEELNNNGIRSAAFKGLAAMATLHGIDNRVIGDIDILVNEADLPHAITCMQAMGLHLDLPGGLSEYVEFIRHSPSFAGNLAVPVCDARGSEIDIHWGLGLRQTEFHVDRLLDRARTVEIFARPVRVVAPADGLILTAHHSLRENLSPESTVKDLLDVESWCGLLQSDRELEQTVERAASASALNPLLTVTTILMRLNPESPAGEAHCRVTSAATAQELQDSEQLADLFALQLRNGKIDKDVLYLVQPRSLGQIAGGLLGGWRKHRRWVQFMENKNTGHSVSGRERLATIVGGLKRMSVRQLSILRTLARTKDRVNR